MTGPQDALAWAILVGELEFCLQGGSRRQATVIIIVEGERDGLRLPDTDMVVEFVIWGVCHPGRRKDISKKGETIAKEEEEK